LVETSEANNTRAAVIRVGPDLAITTLTAPANIGAGMPFNATYTVANSGGGLSGESTTRFYLSTDITLDANDDPLSGHVVGSLDPGESLFATISLTAPADTVGGLYYLLAIADGNQQVAESTETNNLRYVATRVGSDLRVATLTLPARVTAGVSFSVTESTKNFGVADAGSSHTAFYLSANGLLDAGDTPLNVSRPIGPLAPNDTSLGTSTLTLPSNTAPGVWYIIANADDAKEVAESIENNNVRYGAVSVGPDLGVFSATAPAAFTAGTSITVTDTTKNSGIDPAGASTTRFYLSLNGALDGNDTLLAAERAVPALAPNATSTGSTSVPIPTGFSGRYYLLIVADGYGAVAESSEVNNVRVILVTINP
jgi:subtilase family serine protease